MEEQLSRFSPQFSWEPKLEYGEKILRSASVVLCGMGGSHLGARLLQSDTLCPPLFIHSDYGLPSLPPAWNKDVLYIVSSYSGETEEALSSVAAALEKGAAVAVMASGGALLSFAKTHELPHITLPKEDIEPRMAMGYQMRALAKMLGSTELLSSVERAGKELSLTDAHTAGEALALALGERIPLFYASERNRALAYHFKADMNETAKIPSFYNVMPELCHNELSSYEGAREELIPVFITDEADDPRITARMRLMETMLHEQSVVTASFLLVGTSPLHKNLQAVMAASVAGSIIAKRHHKEDAKTPLIREFKLRLQGA